MKKVLIIAAAALLFGLSGLAYYFYFASQQRKDDQETSLSNQVGGFTFLVFGDSGTGSLEQHKLADLMVDKSPDLVIHTGDLAYQSGTKEEIQKNVLDVYKNLFSKTKFYPSLGNHDYETKDGQPFVATFTLPGNERYYSFQFKNALFIALDTNKPLDEDPQAMLSWLENTLKSRKKKTDWTIIYFHHPAYSSGRNHGSDSRVQKSIVPILEKYSVDLVFSGHDHNYQRSCKIRENKCVDSGPIFIVTGGGGAKLYQVGGAQWFSTVQKSAYHFVDVAIKDCSLILQAIDINNRVFDKVGLSKC